MRRMASLLTLAALFALAPAGLAHAGPTREYLPIPTPLDLEGVCPDLTIHADILVNREYGITFSDTNGDPVRMLTAGTLKVRLTNLDNGTSIVRNISGPGETIFHEDGSTTLTSRGTWFFFYSEGQLDSDPSAHSVILNGRTVTLTRADGTQKILAQTGTVEDVCAELG